jgi:hypothetical protein
MKSLKSALSHTDPGIGLLFCAAFIGLNILDASLTGIALALGSSELNPILGPILGSNTLFKWLIASAVVLILVLLKRGRWLKLLSFGMVLVCYWNLLAIWTWR